MELVRERIPIFFNRFCRCCGESGKQQLPVNIVDAVCEHVLPSGHRVDVGLLDERGQLRAVIEVVVFHAVETDKASYLNEFVPWAEFDAVTILGSFCWTPKVDRFKAYICPRCRFVAANSSLLNWVGVGYSFVECPRKNGASVLAVEVCSACDGFVTAAPGGVVCFGEVSLGNEADLR